MILDRLMDRNIAWGQKQLIKGSSAMTDSVGVRRDPNVDICIQMAVGGGKPIIEVEGEGSSSRVPVLRGWLPNQELGLLTARTAYIDFSLPSQVAIFDQTGSTFREL